MQTINTNFDDLEMGLLRAIEQVETNSQALGNQEIGLADDALMSYKFCLDYIRKGRRMYRDAVTSQKKAGI